VPAELQAEELMTGRVVYVELAAAIELAALLLLLLVTEGISEARCVALPVVPAFEPLV
jgi:hypothetical protein